jgi:multidrug resistance protein, MATE family
MAGQAGQMLMNLTDTLVVGRLGVDPLAAVAFANSIVTVPLVFGIGLLAAIAILGSQAHGADLRERKEQLLRTSLWFSLGLGGVLAVIVLVLGPIYPILGPPEPVLRAAKPFLTILAWSLVPGLGFIAAKNYCESLGRPTVPMIILYVTVLLNLFLNVILVFGLLGAPRLGLAGSAYATLVARAASFFGTVVYALRITEMSGQELLLLKLNRNLLESLLRLGLPIGLQLFAEVGAFCFSAIMIGWISADALAAHQIAITCAATTFMFPLGIAQAVTVRIGHALGAGENEQVRKIGWGGLAGSALMMSCSAVTFATLNRPIAQLFSADRKVIAIAATLLFVAGIFQIADGLQVTAAGILRGLADVRMPMWISYACYWCVAIPIGYFVGFVFAVGAIGVWCGLALGLFVAAAVFIIRFCRLTRPEGLGVLSMDSPSI